MIVALAGYGMPNAAARKCHSQRQNPGIRFPADVAFSPSGELFVTLPGSGVISRVVFDKNGNAIPNAYTQTPSTLGGVAILGATEKSGQPLMLFFWFVILEFVSKYVIARPTALKIDILGSSLIQGSRIGGSFGASSG